MGRIRLLLVRHGESVDNLASLYHLVERHPALTPPAHLFASDLQRAYRTAEAIRERFVAGGAHVPAVQRLPDLREKDFGSLEGTNWAKPVPSSTGAWLAPESSEAIALRVHRFLDSCLFPVAESHLGDAGNDDEQVVVVVAHGISLSYLVKAFVARFRKAKCPVLGMSLEDGSQSQPHMPWRNTGYFECLIEAVALEPDLAMGGAPHLLPQPSGLRFKVERFNCVDHLAGLKRTKGGIGSAQFDSRQKTLDSFFQKGSAS